VVETAVYRGGGSAVDGDGQPVDVWLAALDALCDLIGDDVLDRLAYAPSSMARPTLTLLVGR